MQKLCNCSYAWIYNYNTVQRNHTNAHWRNCSSFLSIWLINSYGFYQTHFFLYAYNNLNHHRIFLQYNPFPAPTLVKAGNHPLPPAIVKKFPTTWTIGITIRGSTHCTGAGMADGRWYASRVVRLRKRLNRHALTVWASHTCIFGVVEWISECYVIWMGINGQHFNNQYWIILLGSLPEVTHWRKCGIIRFGFSHPIEILLHAWSCEEDVVFPGCFTEVVGVSSNEPACDPVFIGATMFIGKTVHESVNVLTLEDKKSTASCPVFICCLNLERCLCVTTLRFFS